MQHYHYDVYRRERNEQLQKTRKRQQGNSLLEELLEQAKGKRKRKTS